MYTLERLAPAIYLIALRGVVDLLELQQIRRDVVRCLLEYNDPPPVLIYELTGYQGYVPTGNEDDPYTMSWFRHRGCIYVHAALRVRIRLVYRHLLYRQFLPRAYFLDSVREALALAKTLV